MHSAGILDQNPSNTAPPGASPVDPVAAALGRAGALLMDLAEQAMKLGVFVADHTPSRALAGSLCRRSELARQLGRKLVTSSDSKESDATTLLNDSILALDGVAVDVEYASELAAHVKIKNQVARARLAVTMAGCAIDEVRRVAAAQA